MRYAALASLGACVGIAPGFYIGALAAGRSLQAAQAATPEMSICGLPVLAGMFFGGFCGILIGGAAGLLVARVFPRSRGAGSRVRI